MNEESRNSWTHSNYGDGTILQSAIIRGIIFGQKTWNAAGPNKGQEKPCESETLMPTDSAQRPVRSTKHSTNKSYYNSFAFFWEIYELCVSARPAQICPIWTGKNCCQMSQRMDIFVKCGNVGVNFFPPKNVIYLLLISEINDRKSLGRLTSQWPSFRVKDGPGDSFKILKFFKS